MFPIRFSVPKVSPSSKPVLGQFHTKVEKIKSQYPQLHFESGLTPDHNSAIDLNDFPG